MAKPTSKQGKNLGVVEKFSLPRLLRLTRQEPVSEGNVGRRSREARVGFSRVRRVLLDPCSMLQCGLVSRINNHVGADPVADGQNESWSRTRPHDRMRNVGR